MKEINTETKILEAAKAVFIEKGKDASTMQAIADKAKINKALLHYYFRSKDKLFNVVIKETMFHFLPQIEDTFLSDANFFDKIRKVVSDYITLLSDNPFIPGFMLHEINRNPDGLFEVMIESGIKIDLIFNAIQKELEKKTIRIVSPQQFFVNLLSLCIFPIAARPLLQRALFFNDQKACEQFIEDRKIQTAEFIIQAIKA